MANITTFLPYFYVAYPRGFLDENMEGLREYLNVSLFYLLPAHGLMASSMQNQFESIVVKKIERVMKKSIWEYKGDDISPFLRLTLDEPRNVPKVRDKC